MDYINIFIDNIKNLDIKNATIIFIPIFFILIFLFRFIGTQTKLILIPMLLSFLASFLGSDILPESVKKILHSKNKISIEKNKEDK